MSLYIHHVPGRLRVQSPRFKRNEHQASQARDYMERVDGVVSSEVNTVTGSMVIKYDTNRVSGETLLNSLRDLGHMHTHDNSRPAIYMHGSSSAQKVSDTVVNKLLETVIERSATMLIAALI